MECALTWPLVTCVLSEPGRHNEGFSWITQRGVGFCVFLGEFHLGQVRLELPGGPRRKPQRRGWRHPGLQPAVLGAPCTPVLVSFPFTQLLPETACLPAMCCGGSPLPPPPPQCPSPSLTLWGQLANRDRTHCEAGDCPFSEPLCPRAR